MDDFEHHIETNKKAWNKRTPIHIKSNFYDNKRFKAGQNSLKPIELNAIGDVKGKSLLHLQCHFGQDSISFARMGAKVTAVDFSLSAINFLKQSADKEKVDIQILNTNIFKFESFFNLK